MIKWRMPKTSVLYMCRQSLFRARRYVLQSLPYISIQLTHAMDGSSVRDVTISATLDTRASSQLRHAHGHRAIDGARPLHVGFVQRLVANHVAYRRRRVSNAARPHWTASQRCGAAISRGALSPIVRRYAHPRTTVPSPGGIGREPYRLHERLRRTMTATSHEDRHRPCAKGMPGRDCMLRRLHW